LVLNHLEYNCGDPDGDFGPKTENAEFKAGFGLVKQELPELLLQHIPLLHPMEKAYFNTLKYDRRKLCYNRIIPFTI